MKYERVSIRGLVWMLAIGFAPLAGSGLAQPPFQASYQSSQREASRSASVFFNAPDLMDAPRFGDDFTEEAIGPQVEMQQEDEQFETRGDLPCYAIKTRNFVWFDTERQRAVPFRLYYPVAPRRPCPIILFSHGLGGSSSSCAYLGASWARRGCVSIHLRHFGSDDSVWRGKLRVFKELKLSYLRSWTGRDRADDMRFILDRLEQFAALDPTFHSRLDYSAVGVAGYNLGSLASLLLVGQTPPDGGPSLYDPRITAVIALGPPVYPTRNGFHADYANIDVPCLFINGTEDHSRFGTTTAGQRRIPYDTIRGSEQYLVWLRGADHMSYAGHFLDRRSQGDAMYQREIARASTSFWAAYLLGDPASLAQWTRPDRAPPFGSLVRWERRIDPRAGRMESMIGGMENVERDRKPTREKWEESPGVKPRVKTPNPAQTEKKRRGLLRNRA